MLARSARNPIVLGLGAGAVFVIGTTPPVIAAAGPSPGRPTTSGSPSTIISPGTPTDAPSPPPPDPTIAVAFQHSPNKVQQGSTYSLDVKLTPQIPENGEPPANVTLTVGASRAKITCDINGKRVYTFGKLKYVKLVAVTLSVPSSVTKGKVTLWASASADNAVLALSPKVSLTVKPKSTSPGSGDSSGGSSGGSGGSSNTPSPMGTLSPTSGPTTPAPTPSTAPVLPGISQQPSTANPALRPASNDQAMRAAVDNPDELTFDELASTQAAWLVALFVAFSLLLTQLRLGKVTAAQPRPKGAHRKPRNRFRRTRAH